MDIMEILRNVAKADEEMIDILLYAVLERKRQLYPEWCIEYKAWEKDSGTEAEEPLWKEWPSEANLDSDENHTWTNEDRPESFCL